MIDLHCHSHFSDGLLSPGDLLKKASQRGLKCLSLTDHDTLAGYDELNAMTSDVKIIKGIELSTRWKKYDIHILAYNFQETEALHALLIAQNASRIKRARQIGECLRQVGVQDAYQKACNIAGHERVGRPHFAEVLVLEGKVKEHTLAFKNILGKGRLGYVTTEWASMVDAVDLIRASGGMAVIAHPLKYKLTRAKLYDFIKDFKEAGGVGIEVVSGAMNVTDIKDMAAVSRRFELLASSGSDYHRDGNFRIDLGAQAPLPELCIPIWQAWNIL